MIDVADIPAVPPASIRYVRKASFLSTLPVLWSRREVVRSLIERDFRARYKQAFLGITWALVQPLAMVLVFSVVIRHVTNVSTGGAPYILISYLGLLPWNFFSEAITIGSVSLVSNQALLNKVNCPREAFPTAAVGLSALDMGVSLVGLVIWFAIYGYVPRSTSYMLIPITLLMLLYTLAVTLPVSIFLVYVRDLRQMVPIMMQLGLFATPVAYSLNTLPRWSWLLYSFLNPMGPIIDSYRRVILYGQMPRWDLLGAATITTAVLLYFGTRIFKRMETGIADIL